MDGKTTALLIEDNPGDAILIREMLLELPASPFTVQWADTLAKGLARARAGQIDIVLLDLGLPDSQGLDTFLRLHQAAPHAPIIVLSGREDDDLAVSAVRAGAEDYLVKGTVSADSLGRSIRYTIERYARQRRSAATPSGNGRKKGRVVGFIGAKGGVGTTTVALNAAAAIAEQKRNVILAELRGSCGTLSHHFFQRQIPASNLSRLSNRAEVAFTEAELHACLTRHSTGFGVLFGPQKAGEAKPIAGETARRIVGMLSASAEFVALDLPSEPSESNRNAVSLCDFVGLVLEREPSCVAAGKIVLDHLRGWNTEALIGAIIVHRTPLAIPLDLEQIARELGVGIAGLIPPAADACVLAQKAGTPVVTLYADALVGDSFLKLGRALAEDPIVVRKG
ncbi:MAG: response regulator [Bryobacteraceae bacterium]|nr:response regulator [Bryobacteraceae bacterium]